MMGLDVPFKMIEGAALKEKQNKQRRLGYEFQNQELINQAQNVNKSTDLQESSQLGAANDRGVYNSSIPVGDKAMSEYIRGQKLGAIKRKLKYGQESYDNDTDMRAIQDHINSANMAMQTFSQWMTGGIGS